MKYLLVAPSNTVFMPYLTNYQKILDSHKIEYEIIVWDRMQLVEKAKHIYEDDKIGIKRNFFDYFKYCKYVKSVLKKNDYDRVVVFTLQTLFFLGNFLQKKFKGRFIGDIRDYNNVVKFINVRKLNKASLFFVLSSDGFLDIIGNPEKYLINHNTTIKSINEIKDIKNINMNKEKISIGNIGAVRDLTINIKLIENIRNQNSFILNYNGKGPATANIEKYLKDNNILNVRITGQYKKNDELGLYMKNDFVNILMNDGDLNNQKLLPNRLYRAAEIGIPIVCLKGSHLANIVSIYKLGLVVENLEDIVEEINLYISNFDVDEYNSQRKIFMSKVILDNNKFEANLIKK